MKRLKPTETWILIYSIIVVSGASEHASSHHDVIEHGDSAPWKQYQKTIVPYGIQMPDHVLSTQDLSCISADNNIFEIMNKAQETCNGTDMRCTFYHFFEHGYKNLGTLNINKERFEDLLMKFDNWLLTAENIEKSGVAITKRDSSLETASIGVNNGVINEHSSISIEMKGVDTNQGGHIDNLNLSINKSDDDRVHSHNLKIPHEIRHKIHHGKDHNSVTASNVHEKQWKDKNHIKLNPKYNADHRYFEVYIPEDKVTGKPRTIYVEVDQDKNEFVLLDEEIDKKLNGIKPIRIELDELSEIADTAFSEVAKTSNFEEHVHNHLTDDEKAIISDISNHSAVNVDEVNVDIDVGEQTQNSINFSVSHPYIYNIKAEEQHKPDNMTENVKDNDSNTYDLNGTENSSLDYSDISNENDNDTSTDYYDLPTEYENVALHDDSFVQVEEHNNTNHDIDFDDTYDFSSSNTLNLNEFSVHVENPVQENKLKSTPFNNAEPELTSSMTAGISEYTGSQLNAIPFQNRQQGYTNLHNFSLEPSIPLKPYTTVPILGKDSAKILKTNSYLTSPSPAYATLDLRADDSQNTPSNSVVDHPSITSYISLLDSASTPTAAPKISQYSPPPVECIVRVNKENKYSPINFDVSRLPYHSRIEELRLPCDMNPLSLDHVFSPQESISPLTVPSLDYIGSFQSSPGHTAPVKDITFIQNVPSSSYVIQEPSVITTPYELETTAPMPSKHALLSKLGLPKTNADYESIPGTNPSLLKPCSLKDAVSSPCPIQQILPCLQKNILSPIDSRLIKNSPCETMSPCSANSNRYPYKAIPYFSNPYLQSQFIPSYLEPLLQTPLQPASKIPTLNSAPMSLDQNNICLTGVYPQEKKTIQFLPFTPISQFSPLNPMLVGPSFPPALPCPNIWNNIPYLPYSEQNIRNNPPFLSNYLATTTDHKPLPSKLVPLSIVDHPCSSNNILEITPSSYSPSLPVHTSTLQNNLNPSPTLERDLENLSLKYGIPLSKILHSIETEIFDSKTCSPTLEVPNNNLINDGSLTAQQSQTLSEINENVNDENSSGDKELLDSDLTNLTPLDSSLIGPHLELENSLDAHDSQSYTILSETTGSVISPHLNKLPKPQQTKAIKDSSLIGPHLTTLSSSNIVPKDELVLSESDSSNLMSLDASLTGPHLKIRNPLSNEIQNINEMIPSESDLTDLTPVDISQIDLTSELVQSTIPAKPLLTNEIQTISEMIPLESDPTDLTHSVISQVDFVNEQSEILQHMKSTVTLSANPKLHITTEYLPTNLLGDELLLKPDSSSFLPLDSSLIGPELNFESSPVITDIKEDKLTPTVSQDNLQKTDIKHDELESIILPSSLLPILLNKPVKDDSNLNIISQDTKLNGELIEISVHSNVTPLKETDFKIVEPVKPDLNINMNTQNTQLNDNYLEIPLADTSQIFLKETEFKMIEQIPALHDSNIIPLLPKDSTTLKDKLTSPVMTPVDYEPQLESSLIGTSIFPKIHRPGTSTTLDSSIQLDKYLVGPSILNEKDSLSPVIETVDQLESFIVGTSINQNIKPSESGTIDSNIQFDSSLFGPTVYDSVTQFDTSLVAPSLYEAGTKISSALNAKSHLDTSLIPPSLFESFASSQLDSSLLGTSLKPEMEKAMNDVSHVFDSKKLDSTLIGPHLSTVPFSSNEIQVISNELQQKSELANLIPLDSTLIGPHVDFESQLDQSEISQYQNPELSLTSEMAPGILETIDFLNSDFVERHPPKPNTASSICQSDLQELLSKFKNSITKSQLSPSEFKPCDKLLSSIAKQSTDNINMSPTCSDLQSLTWNTLLNTPLSLLDDTASEFSPITITEKEFSPVGSIVRRPCIHLNDFSKAESLPYAQGVPQIPITHYSPFIQMRPLVDRNWIPQPLNILQTGPGITPTVANAPVSLISNALMPLSPEDLKLLLDLTSQRKTFPQLSMPNIFTPMKAVLPSLEWTTQSNNLSLEKYVPSLPKNNYSILPSNLESSICDSEYTPIEVDNIMSLLDGNSYKLLKDMAILPFSQSSLTPSIPVFEKSEIVSPSLSGTIPMFNSDFIKTRPVLPISISNAMVPSLIYTNPPIGLYNPKNITYMLPTPNVPPCNLQPYSHGTPLDALFSEIVGPVSKIESLPIEPSQSSLESQWHEIPNTPQLMESIPNFPLDSEFLQQPLSKPCLESPIILPSSLLDTMLLLPTASNKSKSFPYQSPTEFFTPVSPALNNPLSNAYTSPITASSFTSDFSSPQRPLKSTPLSNHPIAPTEIYNRPVPSRIPYKPSQMYSSPYLPVYPSPLPVENSPYSSTFMSKLTPAETSPISPVFYEPLTAPYFSPEHKPKSITNLGTSNYSGSLTPFCPIPMASSSTGVLPPSYISPDLSAYKYLPIPAPVNTLTQPSSTLSPTYITQISPVSSTLPSYNRTLPSKPIFTLKPEITTQELENLRLLNTLPISNGNNPFLNANQMLLTSSNILPFHNYDEYVPKWTPLSSSQIKQIKPSEDKIGSNLHTTSLTEETPYEIIEENMYADSNDKDNEYYEDYNFKHPLESLSYTLAPEDIMETERRPEEDFELQDLNLSVPTTNIDFEPSLQSKLHPRPLLTPYTQLYGEPLLSPCPTPQSLPHPALIENLPQSIIDNITLKPSLRLLNRPVSLPASILSSPLLKPLTQLTPEVNLPSQPSPCLDTYLRPYKVLPTDERLSFSSPYYSATRQDMLAPLIDPRGLRNIISPQPTSAFSQVSAPFVPISSLTSSPTSPYNLDNYIELPLTYNEPKSKKQDTLVKPFTVPSYNQYASTTTSHTSPLEILVSSEDISPLTPAESLKKPFISPQYISSRLSTQTKLPEICSLNEAPVNYQPYIPLPTVPSNAAKNILKSPLINSPYTVIPSVKMAASMSTNLNSPHPQRLSFTPQYSLPDSSSPNSKSSPVNFVSNVKYSINTPDINKRPMTIHIIPSSLFMSSDTDFQTIPLEKSTSLQSPPRYSYPSPTLTEPVEIVPYETPKKSLGQTILPQNMLKPNTQYYNGKYATVPLSSSPYLTQPLEKNYSFQTQPLPNVQYTNKPHQNLLPALAKYASPSLAPSYTSLPLETVPNSHINKPQVHQYSLANVPSFDAHNQSSAFDRNPFLHQDFKLITEVPSYPVQNDQISSLKLTPYESILLSNLKPLGSSQDTLKSSPVTSSTPLSLLKSLTKTLTQKSDQFQPEIIPIYSQYVSQSQIDSVPQLLPSSPILKSPLLKPLLTNIQNYSPSLPNYVSSSNIAFSESSPMKSLPPISSNQKYSAPSESLVSELPETLELINPVPITPYCFLKPSFNKKYQSPVTKTNMPIYSNYNVLESSPDLPIKGNYMNTVKPIEVSPISAAESSQISLDSQDTENREEMVSYELKPDLKVKFSQLPLNFNQQRQFYPYLAMPQPTLIMSAPSKYKSAKPRPLSIPSVIPEDVELIDTTDFISILPIQSEALTSSYSPTDRKALIPESTTLLSSPHTILSNTDYSPSTFKQLPLKSIANTQSIQEPDMSQFFPYTILSNSDFSPLPSKQLPPATQKQRINQLPQSSPIYLSPQEYEELTKGLSSSQASQSSPIALPSTNVDPQLITNLLTAGPIPLTPLYASPISKTPENLLQLPLFGKYSPLQETPIEITPEKENIQSLLDKYRPPNKIIPLKVNNYPYEPKSSIVELLLEPDSVKSVNPLTKSKESYVEYMQDVQSKDENNYVTAENVSLLDENKPDVFEAKSFTKSLAEITKGVNIPNYYNDNNVQRPQRLSKLDHFYANNHIGKRPQVFTAPTFNTALIASSTDRDRSYANISPEIYKDFTDIPVKHPGSVPKLDTSSSLSEYYPEIASSVETVPFTNSYAQNYINPSLKSYSQIKPTNAIEVTDTSEIPSSSYNPFNNINDIKYSGYKTYQIPSLKSPKTTKNLGTPQMYSPSLGAYSPLNPVKPSTVHQIPSPTEFYEPTDETITNQYQAPQIITSPLQTKQSLDTLQDSPELNNYGSIKDEPVCVDDIKERNELKSCLINYINKRNDIKNILDNNNQELTIPIDNIAITKNEPYNADTIETNNPSIELKVWKSSVKIAQAELKLKFKDLSVMNFMPVVNNLDKYDMEEIRRIVKNYIDKKYGNHVEISEPYTVDNQYTVIKDFEPNALSNKYNLLWPTDYV